MDEASQFSDLEDQIGSSPAHRPVTEKIEAGSIKTDVKSVSKLIEKFDTSPKSQTMEFLKFESEHSAQVQVPLTESDKVIKAIHCSHLFALLSYYIYRFLLF